jgi:hypothetical protein
MQIKNGVRESLLFDPIWFVSDHQDWIVRLIQVASWLLAAGTGSLVDNTTTTDYKAGFSVPKLFQSLIRQLLYKIYQIEGSFQNNRTELLSQTEPSWEPQKGFSAIAD